MATEIYSPPFSKNSANYENLYADLIALHEWTDSNRDWANMEAQRLNAPEDPYVPKLSNPSSLEQFSKLAIVNMHKTWAHLRFIREAYDEIVRNYEDEDSWNSDVCIFLRIGLIRSAWLGLSLAFLDYEKREAKSVELVHKQRDKLMSQLKDQLQKHFSDFNISFPGDSAGDYDEESDFSDIDDPEF